MSIIYKCDICGKEIGELHNIIVLIKNEITPTSNMGTTSLYASDQLEYDVCSDCYKKIKQKLDNNTIKCESDSCYTCRYHKSCNPDEYPCSQCNHNYTSQYEHE